MQEVPGSNPSGTLHFSEVKHALLLQLKFVSVTSVYGGNIVKIIINDVIRSAVAIQKRWNNGHSVNKENF